MLRRPGLGIIALSAAAVLAAEWMRAPGWILAAGILVAALTAAYAARERAGVVGWLGAAVVLVLGAVALQATYTLQRVERHWTSVREAFVTEAYRRLGGELDQAVQLARNLVDRAALEQGRPAPEAFQALRGLIRRGGPSQAVVLFDAQGQPRAWAGIQRAVLRPDGPELSPITTPFYLWLVARRQISGGTAVSSVLLARADEVPRAGDALTDRFAQATGVGLRFLDPREAPQDSDVFDYVRPGLGNAAVGDTLFAVQPVPPNRADATARLLGEARHRAAVMILLALAAAAILGVWSGLPIGLVPALAAGTVIARAPLNETFGAGTIFSPSTYSQPLLGPFSSSTGALLLTGIVLFIVACALWHRGLRPSAAGRVLAVVGTLLAPYLLQRLARGIAPPSAGVAPALWVAWQVALVVSASALVLLAAALIRGREVPAHAGSRPYVAGAIALGAAALGLWLWSPNGAWPEWYPYVWAPALLLTLRPMPFRSTLATIAVVAGSSAALLTWGATTEGRMALAARDLDGLGDQPDPAAIRLLDRVVHEELADSAPTSAGDLFVIWRRSALGAQDYPASLVLWDSGGTRRLALDLAELDVPNEFVQSVAREASRDSVPLVRPVLRVPGLHGVAAIPMSHGKVLTITVGPRSRLVAPSRVGRFLFGGGVDPEPPYDVVLAPPVHGGVSPSRRVTWRRDGWQLRGERSIALPAGSRHAHASIDLRGPTALLQRGLLLMVLDIAVLAVLWVAVELATGRGWPALRAWWPRAVRSLRVRLSVSLALFFMVPTVALALWSFGRLEEEFRGARELLLQRTLRDAAGVLAADTLVDPGSAARRVAAELVMMRDGVLSMSSAPVLIDLGLADQLVPSAIYPRLAYGDEVELSADQRAAPAPTLVGYRVTARGEGGSTTILGASEFLGDPALRRREADLGIAVLVAGVAGFFAALVLSGFAARALARPLQELRRAALAVGTGEPPGFKPGDLPVELETVAGALAQAAAQVEAGQRAQRVLAWGEMARQVAHEIKNPLTPIRLGVQHLLRVEQEHPAELGAVLPQTGARILAEIDRLDAIARAFSRFAMPGAEGVPVEVVDLCAVVGDVVQLYRVGDSPVQWEADADGGARGMARRDELVEVLVNLCENARDAGAKRVVISARATDEASAVEVRDDGRGIAADILPRIFEPRFSTTTSGSGLGLAIAKRLVESWGGSIAVAPADGAGTIVRLTLRRAP